MSEELLSFESNKQRTEIATTLHSLADQFAGDDLLRVSVDDQFEVVQLTDRLAVELEIDRESTGEIEFEIEITWTEPVDEREEPIQSAETEDEYGSNTEETPPEPNTELPQSKSPESLGKFQLFKDQANEWRWRLVHQNGNIIATSGEGYTTKRNAKNGIQSVLRNAPGADITETDE